MEVFDHTVTRYSIELSGTFDEVVTAFESAVPELDVTQLAPLVRAGDWPAIVTWTAERAPTGFLRFWRNDVRPLMRVAGDRSSAVAYLMGNHVTAERMFRHDPRVMNYAPLRVALTQKERQPVLFTVDRPSDHFASFGIEGVGEVGFELDRELAALLGFLGASTEDVATLRGDDGRSEA